MVFRFWTSDFFSFGAATTAPIEDVPVFGYRYLKLVSTSKDVLTVNIAIPCHYACSARYAGTYVPMLPMVATLFILEGAYPTFPALGNAFVTCLPEQPSQTHNDCTWEGCPEETGEAIVDNGSEEEFARSVIHVCCSLRCVGNEFPGATVVDIPFAGSQIDQHVARVSGGLGAYEIEVDAPYSQVKELDVVITDLG